MIAEGKARGIAARWISAGNPALTAFATDHPHWDAQTLIAEIESEIAYAKTNPDRFDTDEAVLDLGTAPQVIADLESLIAYIRSL